LNTDVSMARRAVHDQLEAQIKIVGTDPDATKANAQIKAIAEMLTVLVLFEAH
jgi:hypothetical protein